MVSNIDCPCITIKANRVCVDVELEGGNFNVQGNMDQPGYWIFLNNLTADDIKGTFSYTSKELRVFQDTNYKRWTDKYTTFNAIIA